MTPAITANPLSTPCTTPPHRRGGHRTAPEGQVHGAYSQPSGEGRPEVNVILTAPTGRTAAMSYRRPPGLPIVDAMTPFLFREQE
ncbi:putative uncharacterized protein [Streptomyces azureus]|uniref:Uncharacterized protein n=1 Tax=Streptomyces azureus TaxID=146537 RepID=A0A0K8PNE9_STRAJ|nr:putative uncharacterized protein [Streptomyces azureus]